MKPYWNQIWSPEKWQRAQEMRAADYHDVTIAKELGFTEAQVRYKFTNDAAAHRPSLDRQQLRAVLNERDALFAKPRALTAVLLGDPLPGRSMLDKRQPAKLVGPPPISAAVKAGSRS